MSNIFKAQPHKIVTRYDVCSLACKAYTAAVSPTNLRSAFAKTPDQVIESLGNKISPSKLYNNNDMADKDDNENNNKENKNDKSNTTSNTTSENKQLQHEKLDENEVCDQFFVQQGGVVAKNVEKKKCRNISSVVGGKAVTEDESANRMKIYIEESAQDKMKRPVTKTPDAAQNKAPKKAHKTPKKSQNKESKGSANSPKPQSCPINSPQPGPSHINLLYEDGMSTDDESESQIPEASKCCQCKRFYVSPDKINIHQIHLTNWAQCDSCDHWVHLTYYKPVCVVRKETPFTCPCCEN